MNIRRIRKTGGALLMLVLALSAAATAYAHGVTIDYTVKSNGEIELQAAFDTGEVMSEAAVTIYSPADPLKPWLTGTADAEGRFVFTVDPEQLGIWDVQFRKAGHGDIVHIAIEAGMIDAPLVEAGAGAKPAAEDVQTARPEGEPPAETVEANEPAGNNTGSVTAAQDAGADATEDIHAAMAMANEAGAAEVPGEPAAAPAQAVRVISSGGNIGNGGGFTTFQIILMSASVIWGFVGTALYFSNKPGEHSHH